MPVPFSADALASRARDRIDDAAAKRDAGPPRLLRLEVPEGTAPDLGVEWKAIPAKRAKWSNTRGRDGLVVVLKGFIQDADKDKIGFLERHPRVHEDDVLVAVGDRSIDTICDDDAKELALLAEQGKEPQDKEERPTDAKELLVYLVGEAFKQSIANGNGSICILQPPCECAVCACDHMPSLCCIYKILVLECQSVFEVTLGRRLPSSRATSIITSPCQLFPIL